MDVPVNQLEQLRLYFSSGSTRPYQFRRTQLVKLRQAILDHEQELHTALFNDLKKSPEESWVTETGFLIAEINHAIRHLHKWMKRKKVPTNLLNFPGKSYIYKEPLGVVLIIGAWNYPLQLLLAPMVGAIAAGNCIVLKPSEFSTATAAIIQKIISETYSPDYIFSVQGAGAEVVPGMMDQFRFDHVFYTGSTAVGKIIYEMAAKKLVPVTLEMGGKSPCIVESDANIKVAARRIAVTKFSNAGQMCIAPDYVLVHQSKKHELLNALKNSINEFYSSDASKSADYGKVINERQFSRLIKYLKEGNIVFGGNYNAEAQFIEPTILDNVSMETGVMIDEIFGPILPIISYNTFEEARSVIDHNPNPLALYVFTESKQKESRWIDSIAFGGGCVNNASWHFTNYNLPFGGRGNSGIGSYHGEHSFNLFSHHKSIMKTPTWFDPKVKYPPFKGRLNLFKRIIK
ncbi:MAG: aldehyde dehydrogenase [Flavisolibacter sp.]